MGQGRELGQDSRFPGLFLGGTQGPWSPGAEHGHCQQRVLVKGEETGLDGRLCPRPVGNGASVGIGPLLWNLWLCCVPGGCRALTCSNGDTQATWALRARCSLRVAPWPEPQGALRPLGGLRRGWKEPCGLPANASQAPSREGRPARSQPESTRLLASRITLRRPQVEDCGFPAGEGCLF